MTSPQHISKFIKTISYNTRITVSELQGMVSGIMKENGDYQGSSYETIARTFRKMREEKEFLYDDNIREEPKGKVKYYWYHVEMNERIDDLHKTKARTEQLLNIPVKKFNPSERKCNIYG